MHRYVGELNKTILPSHIEDLGGLKVELLDSVIIYKCSNCAETEIEIPAMDKLVKAAAIVRALTPIKLSGTDIKFFRRALDMRQKQFAEAMELTPETISRWENDYGGTGTYSEKLVRHNVCALLHSDAKEIEYNAAVIVRMKIAEGNVPIIPFELVKLKENKRVTQSWDNDLLAA